MGQKTDEIFSFNRIVQFSRHSQQEEHRSWLPAADDLPQKLSGKAQLPRYRGRPQVCSSHESSFDPESLSVFFLLHGLRSDLTCQVSAGLV